MVYALDLAFRFSVRLSAIVILQIQPFPLYPHMLFIQRSRLPGFMVVTSFTVSTMLRFLLLFNCSILNLKLFVIICENIFLSIKNTHSLSVYPMNMLLMLSGELLLRMRWNFVGSPCFDIEST